MKCGLRADSVRARSGCTPIVDRGLREPDGRVLPSPRSLHSTPGPGGVCFDPAQTNLIAHRMRQVCLADGLAMFRPVRQHAKASATCGSVRGACPSGVVPSARVRTESLRFLTRP